MTGAASFGPRTATPLPRPIDPRTGRPAESYDVHAVVREHLPGWSVGAILAFDAIADGGVLVEVQRFDSDRRAMVQRTVWIDGAGVVDATVDGRGYIVTDDGRKL